MKIGLLPLYLKLYDDSVPSMRPRIDAFLETITHELPVLGLELVSAPICRVKSEFLSAVNMFENEGAAAIITLHLAYSPSLESIDALTGTDLPILVLDTTENYEFDASVNAEEISFNHGIHGVQDMCNLLLRRGKAFNVFAGHCRYSNVLERVANHCRGLEVAAAFRGAKIGLVGEPFQGMGDFQVPFDELKQDFKKEALTHELAHAFISSYLLDLKDEFTEEELCHFVAKYSPQINKLADEYFKDKPVLESVIIGIPKPKTPTAPCPKPKSICVGDGSI